LVFLYFSEDTFNAAGRRKFQCLDHGTQVLANFDIFAATGSLHKAIQKNST